MNSFDEWAGFDRPRSRSSRDVRSRHVTVNSCAILSARCMLSRRPQGSCPDACRTCNDGVISPVHFGDNRLVHEGRWLDRALAIDGASIVDRRCARDERADISSVSVVHASDSSQPHGSDGPLPTGGSICRSLLRRISVCFRPRNGPCRPSRKSVKKSERGIQSDHPAERSLGASEP